MAPKRTEEQAPEQASPSGTAVVERGRMFQIAQQDAAQREEPLFGANDLAVPFLRILQDMSPQVKEHKDEYLPGARPGMLIDSATRELYDGKEGVIIIPITYQPSFIEWRPRTAGGGMVRDWGRDRSILETCRRDEASGRMITPQGNELVQSGLYYVFQVNPTTGRYKQMAWAMSGSQLSKSRKWNNLILARTTKHPETGELVEMTTPYYFAYHLTSVVQEGKGNSWYGARIEPYAEVLDLPNGPTVFLAARSAKEAIATGKVKVATQQRDEDTPELDPEREF